MAATGPKGMAWSFVKGGSAAGQGKVLQQKEVGMEQAAQGSRHSPRLAIVQGAFVHLSQTLSLDFEWSCVETGVRT